MRKSKQQVYDRTLVAVAGALLANLLGARTDCEACRPTFVLHAVAGREACKMTWSCFDHPD